MKAMKIFFILIAICWAMLFILATYYTFTGGGSGYSIFYMVATFCMVAANIFVIKRQF